VVAECLVVERLVEDRPEGDAASQRLGEGVALVAIQSALDAVGLPEEQCQDETVPSDWACGADPFGGLAGSTSLVADEPRLRSGRSS
jgi:hypothetical protein